MLVALKCDYKTGLIREDSYSFWQDIDETGSQTSDEPEVVQDVIEAGEEVKKDLWTRNHQEHKKYRNLPKLFQFESTRAMTW